MASKATIKAAVEGFDAADDANWTATGLPSVSAVSSALGETVTREDIAAASDRIRGEDADAAPAGDVEGSTIAMQSRGPGAMEGPEPDELFEALERISAAASSPRYRLNQGLQQISLVWRNEQVTIRKAQAALEGRTQRREEAREEARKRARENA